MANGRLEMGSMKRSNRETRADHHDLVNAEAELLKRASREY